MPSNRLSTNRFRQLPTVRAGASEIGGDFVVSFSVRRCQNDAGSLHEAVQACFDLRDHFNNVVRSLAVNVTAFATRIAISSVCGRYYASRYL